MTQRALGAPVPLALAAASDRDENRAPSNGDLVAALRRREAGATLRLYRLVVPVIDRTLLRVLGNRDRDHDDLVQLSLEQLLRSILENKFRLDCSLQHFAAVLSSRLAINELRRRKRAPKLLADPSELERYADRARGYDQANRAGDIRDLVRRALASIRPERAEIVYLYEVEGFQLGEIAALLGSSVASVQSRLVRGRKQLADCIRKLDHAAPAGTGEPGGSHER